MQQLSSLRLDAPRRGSRSYLRQTLRVMLALGFLGGSASVGTMACDTEIVMPVTGASTGATTTGGATTGGTTSGGDCVGGVMINGKCEGKCTPDKCLPGNTCVGNACVLKCVAHTDCSTGTQDCLPAKEDDTAADILVCTNTGRAAIGSSCPFNTECGTVVACPDGKACDYTQCGGMACTKDDAACGADANCHIGTCPDKTACVVPACPSAQCLPLTCKTTGVGDALAYCTAVDCADDAACPGGYYCGAVRDPHSICGLTPAKGNNTTCGKTTDACIDPTTFGKDGNTYFEGSVCLQRKECLRRDQCADCTSNLDCSIQGQTCVKSGAGMHCLRTCIKNLDCPDGTSCVSGSCQPLYAGGCEGKGEFCAPCVDDEDCGSKGSSVACETVNDLSGERACLDTSFPDACMTDIDCPLSPGKRPGHCLDENDVLPTDSNFHKCYFPFKPDGQGGGKFTCGK